jgi:MFS family permease
MLSYVAFSMSAPLIPLQATALGASPGLIGALMSVGAVGSLLIAVPSGLIAQRLGTRTPITAGCLIMAASGLLLYLLPALGTLFFGLALFEIGKMMIIVGAQGHVANLGRGRDAGLDFGWYGSAAAVGQMIGPALAGLAIDRLGHPPAWAIIGGLLALSGAVYIGLIGPGRSASPASPAARYTRSRLRRLFNIPALVAILASFVVIFTVGTRTTFFPLYMGRLGYSASAIGALLSLRAMVSVSTRLVMRHLVALCGGRFPALIASMSSLALGIGFTPLCRDLASLAGLSVLVGLGTGIAMPLSMATVSDGVRPEDRGVALGIRLSGNRVAQLVNPILFGLLIQGFGIATAFWVGGLALAAGTLPIFLWWRQGRLSGPPRLRRERSGTG